MTREELLRNLITEIDLIMHGKDYRFVESEDTWYSRESCRVLTNAEVFEELRAELIQLNNETNREIVGLKKQLENAIVPKFKIGQEVWWIDTRVNSFNEQRYKIESYLIDSIVITKEQFRYYGDDGLWLGNEELFATKEEAEAKLKELKDE